MSPKVPSPVETDEKPRDVKEILYKGHLYDVTDWVKIHPGGNIIKFYTEPGEDASEVIDQFHFRSKDKMKSVMNSLANRPAPPIEGRTSELTAKHQAMSQDFQQLFQELQDEGYFEPSYTQIILRCIEPFVYILISVPLFLNTESWLVKTFCSFMFAYASNRFGWIQHEGGHRSFTGNRTIDTWFQNVAMSFFIGLSSCWWNSAHFRHHAMPQRVHHDIDMHTLPYLTWSEKEVTPDKPFNKFLVKYQGILYWTIDFLVFNLASKFYIHPRSQFKKRKWGEMTLSIFSFYLIYYFGFGWYFLGTYFFTVSMALSFALSHSYLDEAEEPKHWIEYAFTHTANIHRGHFLWVDWYMGYLNYQIEHHLFPTMPQFRHKEITHRVKALAKKHDLPYVVNDFGNACKMAFAQLYNVGMNVAG